ncbi:MAG: 4Fe-4S cluster-binding domain-containing protein [Oscillospiraceae bacterium]|nr:4Fe-4S cluster-binding domain-containing protein [Oscillospiraceae bacterium]
MSHPYKTRKGGATVTIFVPYDCRNNCPFCINKKEYADCSGFSAEKIIDSIRVMDEITPECDFVFTGGEPFAQIETLQRMIDAIPATHKIYINTTFPVQPGCSAEEMLEFTRRNKDKITCINISRHLQRYVEESADEIVAQIATPTRINCVLYKNYPAAKLRDYAERWLKHGIPVQYRYDYTVTTPENLYDEEDDKILHDLREQFTYMGLDGCRMRNGFHFEYKGLHMTYHKTLPYSTIVETDENGVTYDILYDILIKQNGDIHSDWTNVELDVEKYRNVVFEPYDLKVLNGTIDF